MAELLGENPSVSTRKDRAESVFDSINALSDRDMSKLTRYAAFKALAISGTVFHAGAEDLLHEAIARTLDGRRKWADDVDFVTHLKGCIRSIASEYKEDALREALHRQASEPERPTTWASADGPAQETIQRIRTRLKSDILALRVFDFLRRGDSPAEIRKLLAIDVKLYNAARKKIYRCILGLYHA